MSVTRIPLASHFVAVSSATPMSGWLDMIPGQTSLNDFDSPH